MVERLWATSIRSARRLNRWVGLSAGLSVGLAGRALLFLLLPMWAVMTLWALPPGVALAQAAQSGGTPPYDLREHYTKYEYRVPMRDGTRLFTVVYVPKDATKPYPFLVERTPYSCGPYGVDDYGNRPGPHEDFLRSGFIFVCQDVRGRFMSEGVFIEMTPHRPVKSSARDVDESTDMHDTVEWLLKNVRGHNARVGLWGVSYPGFYTSASIIESHPAIKAASPQAPIADFFMGDDAYHGGAFMLPHNFSFATFFKPQTNPLKKEHVPPFDYGTADGYEYFLRLGNLDAIGRSLGGTRSPSFHDLIENDRYNAFWKARAITPHLKGIKPAVLTVGGWFDAENLQGTLSTYRAIERQNPGIVNQLVMGPWVHGGWNWGQGKSLGHVDFAARTSEHFQKKVHLPFFEQHLKGGTDARLPEATVFETGTHVWRQFDAWPPVAAKPRTLYFREGGRLSWEAPIEAQARADTYVSDPNRPVPFVGYTTIAMPAEHMVADQRFAATRPDVLVYQSEVLEEDVTVAGPVSPRVFVSTTGTDSDWVVKLIDVYPADLEDKGRPGPDAEGASDVPPPRVKMAGYQQLLRGNPLRGRFRHSFEAPDAMVPGRVEEIRFDMPDVLHTFRRGHRIMVQVQSSWFPLFDRNPQTFVPIRSARPEDFKVATQQVFRWRDQPSGVVVQVLPPTSGF